MIPLTSYSWQLLHQHACKTYGIDPARKYRINEDYRTGEVEIYFYRDEKTIPPNLAESIASLRALIEDPFRGPILKIAAPDAYLRIEYLVMTSKTAFESFAVKFSARDMHALRRSHNL